MKLNLGLVVFLFLIPATAEAGQIFGSLLQNGKVIRSEQTLVLRCGGATEEFKTDSLGGYRVTISGDGQCELSLKNSDASPTKIFLSKKPVRYDFEIVRTDSGRALKLR